VAILVHRSQADSGVQEEQQELERVLLVFQKHDRVDRAVVVATGTIVHVEHGRECSSGGSGGGIIIRGSVGAKYGQR
jgi:hypothetical protein